MERANNFDLIVTETSNERAVIDRNYWILIDYDYAKMINPDIDREKWFLLRSEERKLLLRPFSFFRCPMYIYHLKTEPIFSVHFAADIKDFKHKTRFFSLKRKDYDLVTYLYWNYGYLSDYKYYVNSESIHSMGHFLEPKVKVA